MINRILIVLILVLNAAILKCYAGSGDNDSISHRYKINEEWYFQLQGGMNYMAAENTRFVNFTEVLSPEMALSIGKRFSPVWGARLQTVFGKDKGLYFANDKYSPKFSFSHFGFLGIGSFNITECLNRKSLSGYNKRFNVSALLGAGVLYTSFGSTRDESRQNILDCNNSTNFSAFVGVEASYSLSHLLDINLELSSNWMNNKYNGQTSVSNSKLKADGLINLLVGVRYTFNDTRRKFKPKGYIFTDNVPMVRETAATTTPLKRESRREEPEQQIAKSLETEMELQPVKTESYYSIEELLEMADNKEPLKGKQLSNTESIRFDYGKSIIKTFASIYLDKVTELLKKENIVLVIKGVMKENGDNQLTERRMKVVRDYLMKHGIERDRLVYQLIPEATPPSFDENTIELGILSL